MRSDCFLLRMQAEACLHSAESLQLRRELAAARQAADPSVVQLRQVRAVLWLCEELCEEAHSRKPLASQLGPTIARTALVCPGRLPPAQPNPK